MSSWRVPANRIVRLCAALAALALAGCGGATKTVTTATIPGVTAYKPPPPAKAATYTVTLAGTRLHGSPRGAPGGSGFAVLTIDPASGQLCWSFSRLTGITAPRIARFYQGFVGATGMHGHPLGETYKPSGCTPLRPLVLSVIEAHPERFYVAIFNAEYPEGAVRGQL